MQCALPMSKYPIITLAHGGGGKLTAELIDKVFRPLFKNDFLAQEHDGAVIELQKGKLAFTTDSFVVSPIVFPGGDIGKLAVTGTINDLAMCGAKPLYMSCGFILEEGLKTETLFQIVQSMAKEAKAENIHIVTGDTKVVNQGKGDQIYINTSGIGIIEHTQIIGPYSIRAGDQILLSSDVGRHGMAILSLREGLEFDSPIESDCASVAPLVSLLLKADVPVHCLRDLTRGGLATALVELAETSHLHFQIDETLVQITPSVRGACEILGLDPLYVANEGCFVAFIPQAKSRLALEILKEHPLSKASAIIGNVLENNKSFGYVTAKSSLGTSRLMDRLTGEQLPRIC